jgi:TetR/AcrR family transcriptional regulator
MMENSADHDRATRKPATRIQRAKREAILEAGLTVFAEEGFRGATLDRIAQEAGLSKPNLLYYFRSKEEIHATLLRGLLHTWLDPLRALDPEGEPLVEILGYIGEKLRLSRDFPRESRLFANEILRGAPNMKPVLEGELRDLVADRARVIERWIAQGRIARIDPVHLIFSIWALTQHYADFDVQVRAVLGDAHDPHAEAAGHLDTVFRRILAP